MTGKPKPIGVILTKKGPRTFYVVCSGGAPLFFYNLHSNTGF